jgi:hypothetical protein
MSTENQAAILDSLTVMHDGAAAVVASGAGQVSAAAKVLDVGLGMFKAAKVIVDISAIALTTDELYSIRIQGAPDATFGTAANIRDLAQYQLGAGEVLFNGTAASDVGAAGERHVFYFNNQLGDTRYRYLRVYFVTAGAAESITCKIYFTNLV